MRVLVLGRTGQVAQGLQVCAVRHPDVTLVSLGRPQLDLLDTSSISGAIRSQAPDVIINAAAWTGVDTAEGAPDAARALNAIAVGKLGETTANLDLPVIHISTDYVFSGEKDGAYREEDQTGPTNVYGYTKLEGEQLLRAANSKHVIVRTSWVHSPFGNNFVKTMLRLAVTRDEVGVVADQRGSPTYALDIAERLISIARTLKHARNDMRWGTYHLVGGGDCVWAEFAAAVFDASERLGGPSARVRCIETTDYPTPARRPANSRLDCTKLEEAFGISMPHWKLGVADCVERCLAAQVTSS